MIFHFRELGSMDTSNEFHVHVSDTDTLRTCDRHCVEHVFPAHNSFNFFFWLGHATDTSPKSWIHKKYFSRHTMDTSLVMFFNKKFKNQPKRLYYKNLFLKLAYFDNLFHVTFCLLLFYSRLWFVSFAQHHPFTFSSTQVSLIIFHSSLPHRCLYSSCLADFAFMVFLFVTSSYFSFLVHWLSSPFMHFLYTLCSSWYKS